MKVSRLAEGGNEIPLTAQGVRHSQPMASVVMTFLNAQKFIGEAIESIVIQTYTNWELLIVDDGSTDGSTDIALRYARHYAGRVYYLEHEGHRNRGMSASRNLGIAHAKGQYIAFLDADDVWLPQKLEQQVAILESQPEAAMVYGPAQFWYGWTGNLEDRQRDFIQPLGVQLDSLVWPPTVIALFLRNDAITPLLSGVLIRHEMFDHIGRFEAVFRGFHEDQIFLTKLCLEAPVFAASTCWHKYRQHPGSYCAVWGKTEREYLERLAFLNWVEDYLTQHGCNNGEVWTVLQRRLWPYRHPVRYRLHSGAQHLQGQGKRALYLLVRSLLPAPIYQWLRDARASKHSSSRDTAQT
jgi:glycosyltransferase involved in cell wall biosynthesis